MATVTALSKPPLTKQTANGFDSGDLAFIIIGVIITVKIANINMMKAANLSWLEIDLKKFRENIKLMFSVLSPKTKYMLMVKGNAYGHGLIEISKIAVDEGASFLGVSSLKEAIELRVNSIKIPVLLLSEAEPNFIPDIIKYKITPTVYNLSYVLALTKVAKQKNKIIPIHIKIDTGLNRFGFKVNQVLQDIVKVSQFKNLQIEGIFTHFADAINDLKLAKEHLSLFNKLCKEVNSYGIYPKYRHTANSPALVWLKESHLDLVRFGLATYGLQPSLTKKYPLPIQPALTWKTKIMQIKYVKIGEYIGYGKTFKAKKDMTIAVIGVGYADGFRRSPLNYRNVLVHGEKVSIVGQVTMNFTMIDVTKLKRLKLYDEVVIIGKQKDSVITLEEIATISETINEEIVTAISALIPRIYLK